MYEYEHFNESCCERCFWDVLMSFPTLISVLFVEIGASCTCSHNSYYHSFYLYTIEIKVSSLPCIDYILHCICTFHYTTPPLVSVLPQTIKPFTLHFTLWSIHLSFINPKNQKMCRSVSIIKLWNETYVRISITFGKCCSVQLGSSFSGILTGSLHRVHGERDRRCSHETTALVIEVVESSSIVHHRFNDSDLKIVLYAVHARYYVFIHSYPHLTSGSYVDP